MRWSICLIDTPYIYREALGISLRKAGFRQVYSFSDRLSWQRRVVELPPHFLLARASARLTLQDPDRLFHQHSNLRGVVLLLGPGTILCYRPGVPPRDLSGLSLREVLNVLCG